jgi:hypothetical protein
MPVSYGCRRSARSAWCIVHGPVCVISSRHAGESFYTKVYASGHCVPLALWEDGPRSRFLITYRYRRKE